MATVVITDAETTDGLGNQASSKVYHSTEYPCHNAPGLDSPYRIEVDEALAKAFGRHLCGTCVVVKQRAVLYTQLEALAASLVDEDNALGSFASKLPKGIELRILAHGIKKAPLTIWSSLDESNDKVQG